MSKVLLLCLLIPSALSSQISFVKHYQTSIYAQEVSRPYELSNGNIICSVQHGQNNVWFNVLYLFDQCGEFITSLHVSTPEEYMFFSDFIQIDANKMIASAFVVDSVYHSVFLTLDINTLEVYNERRYFEGSGLRVDKSFMEQGIIYQLGTRGSNIVSSSMNLELTRNIHLYRTFSDREFQDLRYIMPTIYSRNRVYSYEEYRDPESNYSSRIRCLDGKLRDVYTINPSSDSAFVTIPLQFICLGNDTLLTGAKHWDVNGMFLQKYIQKYYLDSLLYAKPVDGFDHFFEFTVCDVINDQIRCVDYNGRIGVFDRNGEVLYLSDHLVPLMQEGDMSLAITSREGGILSVADNYLQVDGNWKEVLTLIKVTSDFQITEKPDPRCIVSTHEPAEIPVSSVFPNPAGDHISIVSGSTVHRYSISDRSSRLVLSGRPLAKEFDVAIDLVPGMYMIVLETESGTSSLKLLIVR